MDDVALIPLFNRQRFDLNGPRIGSLAWDQDGSGFFSLPAESQRRLVATGIYLPDGKVNLDKAREMGWDVKWAQRKAVADVLALAAAQHK